jgi:hypothetical protein
MKTELLHDMYELNQAFERVIAGLKRIEMTTFALPDAVREWRAQIVTIQVEANRDFLDKVDAILQDEEARACKLLREYKERMGNHEDVYIDVERREAARKKKGLPPRVMLLSDWDRGDEERYDARQFGKRRSKKRGGKQNNQGGKSEKEVEKRSSTASERRGRQ